MKRIAGKTMIAVPILMGVSAWLTSNDIQAHSIAWFIGMFSISFFISIGIDMLIDGTLRR